MHPSLELTPAEEVFLTAWIWDEAHSQLQVTGSAKQAQIESNPFAAPLLADIVVAAMPAEKQTTIANGPRPTISVRWPWPNDEQLRARHREAKAWLEKRRPVIEAAR